jgi:hypothetical protein
VSIAARYPALVGDGDAAGVALVPRMLAYGGEGKRVVVGAVDKGKY